MQRRKFLTAMGSLAAGGAAAMGTGAFNFANVERGVGVNIADDSSAFLALNATSPYADGTGDKLTIEFDGDSGVDGSGINKDSDYSFTGVFSIKNQGSQSVGVWIKDNEGDDTVQWYGTSTEDASDFSTSIEGPGNAYALGTGETIYVNVTILKRENDGELPTQINVKADASQGN